MGSSGSATASGIDKAASHDERNAVTPRSGAGATGVFDRMFGSAGSSTASASAVSASVTEYKDLDSRLAALEHDAVEFCRVEIYTQPLTTGVGQHHGLIYWYNVHCTASVPAQTRGLQIDWGQDGLTFCDCFNAATASARCKDCGITPATVLEQVREIEDRPYNIVHWNCQHFSQHMFDQACGNWHLSTVLVELQELQVFFHSVCICERPGASDPPTTDESRNWVLVYWYVQSGERDQFMCGVTLQWESDGLTFKTVHDGDRPDAARTCAKRPSTQGSVSAHLVEDPPGNVLRRRECKLSPSILLQHLREVEGRAFRSTEWNSIQFATHMFERVLASGDSKELSAHLDDLAARQVEFIGLQEVLVPGSRTDDCHMLVYRYQPYNDLDRMILLLLTFGPSGLSFSESEDLSAGATVLRTKVPKTRRRGLTVRVRLKPSELQRQIRLLDVRAYHSAEWNSEHLFNHLFAQAPGEDKRLVVLT